ncbi:hypothetical protein ACQP25_44935 (plasmid) [Microtetraspora malaysiensis]|uniref:hypothetical protein n=1 Tax=Microtetraspora malaysiensis TaxID=161358 RepID=UPI003D8D08FE
MRKALEAQGVASRAMPGDGGQEPRIEIDIAEAVRLYNEGWTAAQLGVRYGCSRSLVWLRLREAGVKMRDMTAPRASRITSEKRAAILAAYAAGHTWHRICADLHTTDDTLSLVLRESGMEKRLPGRIALDVERLRELRVQGLSYGDLGVEAGCSATTVWRALNPDKAQATIERRKRERARREREAAAAGAAASEG